MKRRPRISPSILFHSRSQPQFSKTRSQLSKPMIDRTMAKNDFQSLAWLKAACSLSLTQCEAKPFASFQPAPLNHLKDESTMSKAAKSSTTNWQRFDAMTEADRHAAANSDPDAQPLTPDDFKRMKRTPRAKIIRRALGLSQEEFAARFHIPIGTLRDWEQGRKEPDAAARSYLVVIARSPEVVAAAFKPAA
jgi:putative transcriptional regulator